MILQDNLKWEEHISSTVLKANIILGKIRNSFKNLDMRTLKVLYTAYVRPILEYGSVAWSPFRKHDIGRIEKVQRRATKLVPCLKNKRYDERLKLLDLTGLEERRVRGDLIQFFKNFKDFNKIQWSHPVANFPNLSLSGPARNIRSHKTLNRQLVNSCPARHNFFTNRVIPYWNDLPDEIKNAESVNSFENKFDSFMSQSTNNICHS